MDGGEGLAEVGIREGLPIEMGEALARRRGLANSLTLLLQGLIVSSVLMAFG